MKNLLFTLTIIALFQTAQAYQIKWGRNITISTPVYEDLYITGGTITINAPVYGDLIVAGGTIILNDTVANDLLLAGGNVTMNGYVADDIRCAGGELNISQKIGGDLVITGGKVTIDRTVIISGGLIASGGEMIVDGTVMGIVKTAAGKMTFNGIANKTFETHSDRLVMNGTVNGVAILAARNITTGNNAAFNNNIRYWNKKGSMDFGQAIKSGTATFDSSLKLKSNTWYFLGRASALGLLWYLGMVFLFLILIQYLFSNTLKKAATSISNSFGKSLLWGLIFFVGVPLVVLLLLVTIIGIPIGVIIMFSYVGLIVLATIITSLVFANWYNTRFNNGWTFWQTVSAALGMFILLKIISFTPFFGWLIMLVIAFVAFGSIVQNIDWRKKHTMAVQ